MNRLDRYQVYVPTLHDIQGYKYWEFHQKNFTQLVLSQGITIKAYIQLYQLRHKRAYRNLRCIGVTKLRRQFWDTHRRRFQDHYLPSGKSAQDYIRDYQLTQKTAALELKRQPPSAEWAAHQRRFHYLHQKSNLTIAQYAKTFGLNPSTARRYLHKP